MTDAGRAARARSSASTGRRRRSRRCGMRASRSGASRTTTRTIGGPRRGRQPAQPGGGGHRRGRRRQGPGAGARARRCSSRTAGRVAVLGFDEVLDPLDAVAGPNKPGTAAGHDFSLMVRAVKDGSAERADLVVVMIHWGVELDTQPREYQVEEGHRLIDAGADMIFGAHSHRLQPMSVYHGRPDLLEPRELRVAELLDRRLDDGGRRGDGRPRRAVWREAAPRTTSPRRVIRSCDDPSAGCRSRFLW